MASAPDAVVARAVIVSAHDPGWAARFEEEARRVAAALGPRALEVHHIGSTAVPGLPARPVLDLLVELRAAADLDELGPLVALGYEPIGEHGVPRRRFWIRSDEEGRRTHNLFAFPPGHPAARACLVLRDWWLTHRDDAARYGDLKVELAALHPDDLAAYQRGKDELLRKVLRRAAAEQR